jgi:AAA15 family ATPase/GTPase
MVNAQDGYLLIDEFENSLHYSVQEQVWKAIFSLAKSLNVQVFFIFLTKFFNNMTIIAALK